MLRYSSISSKVILLVLSCILLNGCWSNVFTGASLIYDRHNLYIKLNDYDLAGKINKVVYKDKKFKCDACAVEIAVFNRDVLIVGSVPTKQLRQELINRVKSIPGERKVFIQVTVSKHKADPVRDSWITGNIRSKIIADSSVDPHEFKVVTSRQIVYLLGDVRKDQANTVIRFAAESPGVRRVVNCLRYYKFVDPGPSRKSNSPIFNRVNT